MAERKEIDMDDIARNFSYNNAGHYPKRSSWFSEIPEDAERGIKKNTYQYDHDAHARHIQHWAKQIGLKDYISVEVQTEKIYLPEIAMNYFTKYKIIISGLRIMVRGDGSHLVDLNSFSFHEYYPINSRKESDRYSGGYYLIFKDNEFVSKDKKINAFLSVASHHNGYLSFDDNIFDDVDLYCSTGYSTYRDVSVVELKKNTFNNRHVTIAGQSIFSKKYRADGFSLDDKIASKILNKARLEEFINRKGFSKIAEELKTKISGKEDISLKEILRFLLARDERISINPHDMFYEKPNSLIRIVDNKIPVLKFGGSAWFYFRGRNRIDSINDGDSDLGVFWGAYQNTDPEGRHAHANKKIFTVLKQKAAENNDVSQELILKREITKSDYAIARQEEFNKSFQDRFIYKFSHLISDYGISWWRPIIGLLIVNLLLCFILYLYRPDLLEKFGYVYFEMFNITSDIEKTLGVESWFVSLINFIQKVCYATVIYEAIKILRRFSRV